MKRVLIVVFLGVAMIPVLPQTALAALPRGVPKGASEARIWGWVDGDTLKVRFDDKTEILELTGVDAPEFDAKESTGECWGKEASDHIRTLVYKKQTVYLEKDKQDRDDEGHLLRYLWVPGEGKDAKAFLLNTKQVRDGYAAFKQVKPNTRYDNNLKTAHRDAKAKKRGLWEFCASVHAKTTLAETTTTTSSAQTQSTTTQGFSPAELAYALDVAAQVGVIVDSMNRFADLMADPRVWDEDWMYSVAFELFIWQQAYTEAQQLTPPPVFAETHSLYLQALSLLSSAADDIAYGIDYLDVDAIYRAADKIDQATSLIEQASRLVDDIMRERGVAMRAATASSPSTTSASASTII